MSEEKKTVELKEEDLRKVNGGIFDPSKGRLKVCTKCGGEQWESELGPGNTCRFCRSYAVMDK